MHGIYVCLNDLLQSFSLNQGYSPMRWSRTNPSGIWADVCGVPQRKGTSCQQVRLAGLRTTYATCWVVLLFRAVQPCCHKQTMFRRAGTHALCHPCLLHSSKTIPLRQLQFDSVMIYVFTNSRGCCIVVKCFESYEKKRTSQ